MSLNANQKGFTIIEIMIVLGHCRSNSGRSLCRSPGTTT